MLLSLGDFHPLHRAAAPTGDEVLKNGEKFRPSVGPSIHFPYKGSESSWRGQRASWRGLRANWRCLRASQRGLRACKGGLRPCQRVRGPARGV